MSSTSPLPLTLIADLLAQPTATAQAQFLQQANLWHEAGLAELIQAGGRLINLDLPQARLLLDACIALAPELTPGLRPQAIYLRAQTLAMSGEFNQALAEIEQAREGYLETGQTAAALRTNVGLLNVLIHQGRYQEALETAETALTAVAQAADLEPDTVALLSAHLQNNRGICYKFMGRYAEARHAYQIAEGQFAAVGQQEDVANMQMNLGVVLAELGYGSEALTAYETAVATYLETGNRLRQAQSLENMGELHLWLGNYSQSLDAFAQARSLLTALGAPIELHILERMTADAYLTLNLLPEAEAAYRSAINALSTTSITYHLGWALWGLGATLMRRQQLADALLVLNQAAEIFTAAENDHLRSAVMLEQAALFEMMGDREAALQQTQQVLTLIEDQDWPVQRIYANLRLADLLLPDTAVVEPILQQTYQLAETLPLPSLRYRIQQRLGRLYLLQGREVEAEEKLIMAVAEIEHLRGNLARQTLRTSFLQDKTAVYADLIQLYLTRGDQVSLQKAFSIAEQVKSRALVDLLSGAIETQLQGQPDSDLTTRLQRLQADLHAIYNEALQDRPVGDRAPRLVELNERAVALEQEINRLRLQLVNDPVAIKLTQPLPFSALPHTLAADQTLLAYHILGDEVLAFVYGQAELRVVRQLCSLSELKQQMGALAVEWHRFQANSDFIHRHLPRLTISTQHILQTLYHALITPLGDLLNDVAQLVVIPHGLLHHLPFAALYDGHAYLLDKFELTIAPSVTVLQLCQRRPRRSRGPALVFGVDDPLIPFALKEAATVSGYLPQSRLFMGQQATLAALRAETANCSLLHLACHGLFRRDNPFFSALKLHDGWLTAGEAMQLQLQGAFIALSACESGRSEVIGGDELLGLSYAFLAAGAAGLLVSLWLVEDETTVVLMTEFYHCLAQGESYPAALRRAQLSLKATHPHPYYWAPFVLVGL